MNVMELNREQIIQLKQNYLIQYFQEVVENSPTWSDMANADNIVDDEIIFETYSHYTFSEDDFF